MAASFQNKLNELERRLKAENEANRRDRTPRNFALNTPSPRRNRPTGLIRPGALRTESAPPTSRNRPRYEFPFSPSSIVSRPPPDSQEIEQKYQAIMKNAGIMNFDHKKHSIESLAPLGELGHGTCGHVVKMRHNLSGNTLAVKQMRRSGNKEENKRIIMDLDVVIKSHDCPYIVQCMGYFITDSEVWICMELMATCLDKLLKRLKAPIPERIIGKMTVAIVKALHYLKEEHGVIHRDIKPSNILLDENGTVKLCDFGISGRLVDSKAKTRNAGCAAYMAPERIDPPDPTRPDYDIRADVWSLGITLVELATGEFPYKNCRTDFEVLTNILQEDPPTLPADMSFSSEFRSFVKDCLTKDYKRRPKYKKLIDHSFIRKYQSVDVDIASWFAEVIRHTDPLVDSPGMDTPSPPQEQLPPPPVHRTPPPIPQRPRNLPIS